MNDTLSNMMANKMTDLMQLRQQLRTEQALLEQLKSMVLAPIPINTTTQPDTQITTQTTQTTTQTPDNQTQIDNQTTNQTQLNNQQTQTQTQTQPTSTQPDNQITQLTSQTQPTPSTSTDQTQSTSTDQTQPSQPTPSTSSTSQPTQSTSQTQPTPSTSTDNQTTQPAQPTQPTQTQTTKAPKSLETFPYTCPLCLEAFESRRQLYRVVGCRHLYCQECVVAYYKQSIQDHKRMVKCPCPDCTTEILFCNVKNLLDVESLIKYQRLSLKFAKNQQNAFIWCPGVDCKAKIMRQKGLDSIMCRACKLRVCFKCGEWEHPGVECDQADALTDKKIESEKKTRDEFEKWKKECGVDLKNCPKCGAIIERTSGCSHMTCRSCQYQFCFVCLVPTRSTHCR